MNHSFGFESFDARILFRSNDPKLLNTTLELANKSLLGEIDQVEGPYDVTFEFDRSTAENYVVHRNGEYLSAGDDFRMVRFLDDVIRITVAEYSRGFVFLHAGAVAWKGKGILLPGMSFHGKSSFVTELVKAGADYYSDDFAILDEQGRLHPFARKISMRRRDGTFGPYELDPRRDLGGQIGGSSVPVGHILLTQYRRGARFNPKILSAGEGVLATLPFAIPLQRYPEKCMRVLNSVASSAILARTFRGDAKRAAIKLLDFVETHAPA